MTKKYASPKNTETGAHAHAHCNTRKTEVTYVDLIANIGSDRPGVFFVEYQHDDDCKTLNTGRGDDCTCTPDVRFFLLDDDQDAGHD